MMTGETCYCAYLQKLIDHGLCYDMQMVCNGYINPFALPDIHIDKAELTTCCEGCKYKL